jgi:hypothetical protein
MIPLYVIYAPIGAFGNHARWLTLLDDGYKINFADGTFLQSTEDKIQYIQHYVYNDKRSYHNWLKYEWTWRNQLSSLLKMTHDMSDMFDGLKTIGLTMNPELAHRCYYKFNPTLNGINKDDFLKMTSKINQLSNFAGQCIDTFKPLDSSVLYQEVLDKNFYQQLIEFFNLESKYQQAQEIHKSWFRLHQKAEQEFLTSIQPKI